MTSFQGPSFTPKTIHLLGKAVKIDATGNAAIANMTSTTGGYIQIKGTSCKLRLLD